MKPNLIPFLAILLLLAASLACSWQAVPAVPTSTPVPLQTPVHQPPALPSPTPLLQRQVVCAAWLNVRSGPGYEYPATASLAYLSPIEATETQVSLDGGQWGKTQDGWVNLRYVCPPQEQGK